MAFPQQTNGLYENDQKPAQICKKTMVHQGKLITATIHPFAGAIALHPSMLIFTDNWIHSWLSAGKRMDACRNQFPKMNHVFFSYLGRFLAILISTIGVLGVSGMWNR
jgi:hypothetical protein